VAIEAGVRQAPGAASPDDGVLAAADETCSLPLGDEALHRPFDI
jgi:hypothetical protein